MISRSKHPSGKPKPREKQGIVSRVNGQPEGFINPRLGGPWHDTHACGFTDPRRQYQFDDEDEGRKA